MHAQCVTQIFSIHTSHVLKKTVLASGKQVNLYLVNGADVTIQGFQAVLKHVGVILKKSVVEIYGIVSYQCYFCIASQKKILACGSQVGHMWVTSR